MSVHNETHINCSPAGPHLLEKAWPRNASEMLVHATDCLTPGADHTLGAMPLDRCSGRLCFCGWLCFCGCLYFHSLGKREREGEGLRERGREGREREREGGREGEREEGKFSQLLCDSSYIHGPQL